MVKSRRAKNEFEKWWNKKGKHKYNVQEEKSAANDAWLAALQWAANEGQAVLLSGHYYLTRVIYEETIDDEIKKINGELE